MSYFAAAAVKDSAGWSAAELSLTDAADIEDVADRLREVAPAADVSILFIESDDTYLVILRLDEGDDLRVFGSDRAFAEESRLGALLLSDLEVPPADLVAVDLAVADPDTESDEQAEDVAEPVAIIADAEPAGDADLLADLGMPGAKLLALCAREGMLPSDMTAEIGQVIGCGDEIEELREA